MENPGWEGLTSLDTLKMELAFSQSYESWIAKGNHPPETGAAGVRGIKKGTDSETWEMVGLECCLQKAALLSSQRADITLWRHHGDLCSRWRPQRRGKWARRREGAA